MERRLFSKEEAMEIYSGIREAIRKELEIKFVQQKIRDKLLGVKSKEIELNFFERTNDDDLLLSQSNQTASEFMSEESNSEFITCKNSQEDLKEESELDNGSMDNQIIKRRQSRVHDYLEEEAEYSGEEEEGYEDEDNELDLEGLIDSSFVEAEDNSNDLFVDEKRREDEKQLNVLKNKFLRRKKDKRRKDLQLDRIDENFSDSSISIDELESDMIDLTENDHLPSDSLIETVKPASANFKDDGFFNDEKDILERLNRKEDRKGFGFKENP